VSITIKLEATIMLIRFEIPDKEGQKFKELVKSNDTTMSKLIRKWITNYLCKENNSNE
jgi:hypothetical protein